MNQLSWLLYLADVAGNAGVAAWLGIVGCAIAAVVFVVSGAFIRDFAEFKRDPDAVIAQGKALQRKAIPLIAVAGVILAVGVLVPSRSTIMLIAASEVGETVLASKDVQSIGGEAGALATDSLKLLRKYVTEQLGEAVK